jgi:ferric-dicitrate binding protein FerR (iron transport regulator)
MPSRCRHERTSGLPDLRQAKEHVGLARFAPKGRRAWRRARGNNGRIEEHEEMAAMKKERKATPDRARALGRREFLRTLGAGATAAAAGPLAVEARADTETNDEKRKARYQPNSAEVQTFYRVNRYPG